MKQRRNNSEACRLVGIHRKTGQRWRRGRRHREFSLATDGLLLRSALTVSRGIE
ncbi:helix-turn-helix domain-containing protein [Mycobacterium sp.]|uniref:helix-turn-helix domain-containing protein n=1 Tax=Mycobacterium sp. TaxID=1785 RepID=UPI003445B059